MSVADSITAVVVSYNSASVLPACLAALRGAGLAHIVVVDNASADQSAQIAQEFGAELLQNTHNIGFGPASNAGFECVHTPFAFLVNPDCTVALDCAQLLLDAANTYTETAIFTPLLRNDAGHIFVRGVSILCPFLAASQRRKVIPNDTASYPVVSGAAMLIRMAVFEGQPIFDSNIFLYHEDDDLCRRVWQMGRDCVIVPAATAVHEGNTSSPITTHLHYWKGWHMAWSELYVRRKHGLGGMKIRRIIRMIGKYLQTALTPHSPDHAYTKGYFAGLRAYINGMNAKDVRIS